jgi:uncharacterized caspase-like protein
MRGFLRAGRGAAAVCGIVAWAGFAQTARHVKDAAEYALFTQARQDVHNPAKQIEDLTIWAQKYPDSEYKDVRTGMMVQAYSQVQPPNPVKVLELAGQLMARDLKTVFDDPKTAQGQTLQFFYAVANAAGTAGSVALPNPTAAQVELGWTAARWLKQQTPAYFAAANRPATTSEADWAKARAQIDESVDATSLALTVFPGLAVLRKNPKVPAECRDIAQPLFERALRDFPNNAFAAYQLGKALQCQQQVSPETVFAAVYEYERAVAMDPKLGGAAPDPNEILAFADRTYVQVHGSTEGLDELKQLVKRSALPPAGFRIKTPAEVAAASHVAAAVAKPQRGATPTPTVARPAPSGTRYFALVIGNNDYRYTVHLRTAVSDAQQIERVLKTQYGFTTELLVNATRDQILGAMNRYRKSLPAGSAFLLYYAGHGYFDKETGRAYWLPVDARTTENTNWISADDITANVRAIPARQVLVISDSCYSGALSREVAMTPTPATDRARFLEVLRARGPSRILLASGGNEPVADAGGTGNHSVFASAVLRGLENPPAAQFTVEELFIGYVREAVAGRSGQVPECSPLRNSGHDSGSFIFERKK